MKEKCLTCLIDLVKYKLYDNIKICPKCGTGYVKPKKGLGDGI